MTTTGSVRQEDVDEAPPPVSWKQFLLRDYQADSSDRGACAWSVFLVLVWLAIFVVITLGLIDNWPAEPITYSSNNPIPRKGYTCACSLPLNLQEPEPTESSEIKSPRNLNQCYPCSTLETITILQYPTNNTGLDTMVRQFDPGVIHVQSPGYVVQQEAHELTVGNEDELKTLYRNEEIGLADEDIEFPLQGYILRKDFMAFPRSYIRMGFHYECHDCSTCGLEVMNEHVANVTRSSGESWGSCYYWSRYELYQCNANSTWTYVGKCVLYPTQTLPFSFAIKTFIQAVNQTAGIQKVQPLSGDKQELLQYASVQSNVVYLNKSRLSQGTLQHGFVETTKGSALWAWLLNRFPNSITACENVPDMRDAHSVCNGTSVCNAFVKADDGRSIQLKCKNWESDTDCEKTVETAQLRMDNRHGSPDGVSTEAICHRPRHSCLSYSNSSGSNSKVPAYRVTRFAPSNSSDPINAYLNWNNLSNEWLLLSGVCTNTYTQVYRLNNTTFYQANCTNGTDLCTLSSRYYRISDFSEQEPKYDDSVFNHVDSANGGDLFVCYKIRKQPWIRWTLNYVNVLFSWLGLLVFVYLSGAYKIYGFLRARYAHRQNRPRWINFFVAVYRRITSCNLRRHSPSGLGQQGQSRRSLRRLSVKVPSADAASEGEGAPPAVELNSVTVVTVPRPRTV